MMPDVDGPATLERLRPVLGHDVPVVFLTAKAQPADVERLKALGAVGVIAKPFDPLGLCRRARRDHRPLTIVPRTSPKDDRAGAPAQHDGVAVGQERPPELDQRALAARARARRSSRRRTGRRAARRRR